MAIALVGSGKARNSGANSDGFTTGSFDTSGANFIIVSYSASSTSSETLTDSKGNTWTALTASVVSRQHRFYYAYNATVGTGHTFTISGTATFPSLCIAWYSGVQSASDPIDQQARNGTTGTSVTAGPITPSVNGCLVATGLHHADGASTRTITGFTLEQDETSTGFGCDPGSYADVIQTTAAAVSAAWSNSGGAIFLEATVASFKPAASAAVGASPPQRLGMGRVGDPPWQWRQRYGTDAAVTVAVADRVTPRAAVVVKAPLPAKPPTALTRALRQRSDTDSVERRVGPRVAVKPARPLSKPPTVITRTAPPHQLVLGVAVTTMVVNVPRALAAPRTTVRSLPRAAAVAVVDRVTPRSTVVPNRAPAAKPALTAARALRQRLDTDAFERRTNARLVKPAQPLRKPPAVEVVGLRQRLDTASVERRLPSRVTNPPRPLAQRPTVKYATLRQRSDTDSVERRVAKRMLVVPAGKVPSKPAAISATGIFEGSAERWRARGANLAPKPGRAATTRSVALRQRLDTDAVERRVAPRLVKPARPLSKPPTLELVALRQRLDTDAFQRRVAKRVVLTPAARVPPKPVVTLARPVAQFAPVIAPIDRVRNRAVIVNVPAAKPVRTNTTLATGFVNEYARTVRRVLVVKTAAAGVSKVAFARPVWRTVVAAAPDRWRNRTLLVNVPAAKARPTGSISATGIFEGSAVVDRFRNRTVLVAVPAAKMRPTGSMSATGIFEGSATAPVADDGLVLVTQLTQPAPRSTPVPRVVVRTLTPWARTVVGATPDRVRNRALIVNVPAARPVRTNITLATGFTNTAVIATARVVNRLVVAPSRPATFRKPATLFYAKARLSLADGGLVPANLPSQALPKSTPAPTIRLARPIWRTAAPAGAVVDRVTLRVVTSRVRPTVATQPAPHIFYAKAKLPFVDGGLVPGNLPSQLLPRSSPAPTVRFARPIWRAVPPPRVTPRVVTVRTSAPKPVVVAARALRQRLDTEAQERRVGRPRTCVRPPQPAPARARIVCKTHRQRLDTDAFQRHAADRFHLNRIPRPVHAPIVLQSRLLIPVQPPPATGLVQFDNGPARPRFVNLTARPRFRNRDANGRFGNGKAIPTTTGNAATQRFEHSTGTGSRNP